jgi:hypothetical protein
MDYLFLLFASDLRRSSDEGAPGVRDLTKIRYGDEA